MHFRRRPFRQLASEIHDNQTICQIHDEIHIMLDQDDRDAELLANAANQLRQRRRFLIVHPGGRFIQQNQLRMRRHRARNLQFPLLTVRKLGRDMVRHIIQPHVLQEFMRFADRIGFLLAHGFRMEDAAPKPRVQPGMATDENIFQHRHVCKETDILKCAGNPAVDDFMRLLTEERLPVEKNVAAGHGIHAGNHIENRRLPGAVRPDDAEDVALLHAEGNIGESRDAAEFLHYIPKFE